MQNCKCTWFQSNCAYTIQLVKYLFAWLGQIHGLDGFERVRIPEQKCQLFQHVKTSLWSARCVVAAAWSAVDIVWTEVYSFGCHAVGMCLQVYFFQCSIMADIHADV